MMRQKAKFPLAFIPDVHCQIIELPYVGKDLSMLIMLPNEMEDDTTGLQKVRDRLLYVSTNMTCYLVQLSPTPFFYTAGESADL